MNVKADDSDAWSYIESIARPIYSKTSFMYAYERDIGTLPVTRKVDKDVPVLDERSTRENVYDSLSCEVPSVEYRSQRTRSRAGSGSTSITPIYQESCGLVSCIDKNTRTRIDRGLYPIDKLLDLHGYNQDTACGVLLNFITSSFMAGHRCVLVITGWGSKNSGKNSIKSNFHKWLQSSKISDMLLYYTQAIPSHGGKGAFYVLLRNRHKFA